MAINMTILRTIALIFCLISCHINVDVTKRYQLYFDDEIYGTYQKGLKAYEAGNYLLVDSLLSDVVARSNEKISKDMPIEFNPYYYLGYNSIELGKYEEAIKYFDFVTNDTTTNTDILLAQTETFRMLGNYDTAIDLCNRLLELKFDSSIVLSQRGICYYQKKDLKNACADLLLAKELKKGSFDGFDDFLKDCK